MSLLPKEIVMAGLREAALIAAGFKLGVVELADASLLFDWAMEPLFNDLVHMVDHLCDRPLIPDGWITTSPLLADDERAGWARTVSRVYRLGPRLEEALK